ncbi:MAG: ArsR/SmtB family transcription factor [Desulfotomaculales bacterium]
MGAERKYTEPAKLLKVLAHPIRICIVTSLMQADRNVSKMVACVGVPQSTVSQQLAILKAQGVVEGERFGNEVHYRLIDEKVRKIVKLLLAEYNIDPVDGQNDAT